MSSHARATSPRLRAASLAVAILCLPLVLALRGEPGRAWAGEPAPGSKSGASAMPSIERIDGTTWPGKPAAGPPPTAGAKVPACALARYARLAEEKANLEATYASDPPGLAKAYAARKNALVGQAAMDAIGCRGGTP